VKDELRAKSHARREREVEEIDASLNFLAGELINYKLKPKEYSKCYETYLNQIIEATYKKIQALERDIFVGAVDI